MGRARSASRGRRAPRGARSRSRGRGERKRSRSHDRKRSERSRSRGRKRSRSRSEEASKRTQEQSSRRKSRWEPEDAPLGNLALALPEMDASQLKPQMCMRFTEGLCSLGDACPAAHSLRHLAPGGLKPRLCPSFGGICPRGTVCVFAHTVSELPAGFKTGLCSYFSHGRCGKQMICGDAHGPEEISFFRKLLGEKAQVHQTFGTQRCSQCNGASVMLAVTGQCRACATEQSQHAPALTLLQPPPPGAPPGAPPPPFGAAQLLPLLSAQLPPRALPPLPPPPYGAEPPPAGPPPPPSAGAQAPADTAAAVVEAAAAFVEAARRARGMVGRMPEQASTSLPPLQPLSGAFQHVAQPSAAAHFAPQNFLSGPLAPSMGMVAGGGALGNVAPCGGALGTWGGGCGGGCGLDAWGDGLWPGAGGASPAFGGGLLTKASAPWGGCAPHAPHAPHAAHAALGAPGAPGAPPGAPGARPLAAQACVAWQMGGCSRGSACAFVHH